jgi:hypothetical protein
MPPDPRSTTQDCRYWINCTSTSAAVGGTGYFSTANVEACEKAGIEPLIAVARTLRDVAARARKSDQWNLSSNAISMNTDRLT